MIDLHAHILPGFDDGVRSLEEARDLARAAAAEGVTAIAATPHVRDDFPTTAEQMERGVQRLRADFEEQEIPVEILYGGELGLERLWELSESEVARFSLAQTGRYVLVEFPYRGWPPILDATIVSYARRGVVSLIAHPERNGAVQADPERVQALLASGALVQITAASLQGLVGRSSQATAHRLLELGFVHVLASDGHGPHIRMGGMLEAAEALGDPGLARYLTTDVPAAIVAGTPVPAQL